ncbi:MAG: hypothetical protein ACK5QT_02945 [Oligoflexia bacterium]
MNWLSEAQKSLASAETFCVGCARALTLRLCTLFLHRLGEPLASELVALLPEREQTLFSGALTELGAGDASIGYPDFEQHAAALAGDCHANRLIDAFLSGLRIGLPESIEARIAAALPLELRVPFSGKPWKTEKVA